jgi:hypothetical protein
VKALFPEVAPAAIFTIGAFGDAFFDDFHYPRQRREAFTQLGAAVVIGGEGQDFLDWPRFEFTVGAAQRIQRCPALGDHLIRPLLRPLRLGFDHHVQVAGHDRESEDLDRETATG